MVSAIHFCFLIYRGICKDVSHNISNFYILMKFCEGGSLSGRIHHEKKEILKDETFKWLAQTAAGMTYLHSEGIVHRDLKPAK